MDTTAHDLKILSICYYIQAGIIGVYSLFILGYAAFIGTLFQMILRHPQANGQEVPPWLGSLLATILVVVFCLSISWAACMALTGRWLVTYKHKLFCQIIAGFSCAGFPYGTVLGILTFIVLGRSEATRLFASVEPVWTAPAPPPPPEAQA